MLLPTFSPRIYTVLRKASRLWSNRSCIKAPLDSRNPTISGSDRIVLQELIRHSRMSCVFYNQCNY